ncbi:o-succinylbenzoate synthase [Actinomyces faecalis]|uniref:o-succinylbenzoate synthase n=1 Tax=Actinomyces faecalis TaxID=2722820 RepID=UPI001553BDA7|nr:o-succinylbenzoate synthase [Actinomyces faecalis]
MTSQTFLSADEPVRAAGELDLDQLRRADPTGLLAEVDRVVVWDLPMRTSFRGIVRRDGVALHGPAGWGEVAPFWSYDAAASAPWLASALEQAVQGVSDLPTHRTTVPVNVTVPLLPAEQAYTLVSSSAATTAKVKVSGTSDDVAGDLERLAAVRAALGPEGAVRVDVNAAWDLETARATLPVMNKAAGGLQYAEQPCADVEDLARLRRAVSVPIAADESVRLSADPLAVARQEAADVVVLKVAPLGGVRRALALAQRLGLPAVVSSALDTSIGIAAGLRLAAALPGLAGACGLGTVSLFEADLAVPSLVPRGGELEVRPAHVSQTMLTAQTADHELAARWQTRLVHMLGALAARREQEASEPGAAVAGLTL